MTAPEIVAAMVKIPSENLGPHMPLDTPVEKAMGEFVGDFLADHGIKVQVQEVFPGRNNIIGTIPGTNGKTLLMDAHMDTVQAGQMEVDPFGAEIRDGKLWGRGACDDKGILGAMLWAAAEVSKGPGPGPTVIVSATVDEESKFHGIEHLVKSGVKADAAIVGEPTNLELVVSTKGTANFQIIVRGKSAHTCHPERGLNAIYKMTDVIAALRDRLAPRLAQITHPRSGSAKLTVSVVQGGHRVNIVPDRCVIDINRRLVPGEDWIKAKAEIQAVLDELKAADPDLEVELTDPYAYMVPTDVSEQDSIVQALRREVEKVNGSASVSGVPYTSHASCLAPLGMQCVVFGPGSIDHAHTAAEFVPVDEVEKAGHILLGLCRNFGNN